MEEELKRTNFNRYRELIIADRPHVSALKWADVDPAVNPFDRQDAKSYIEELLSTVLSLPNIYYYNEIRKSEMLSLYQNMLRDWSVLMTIKLVEHFGLWASGWNYVADEGDIGGGPVKKWCCATDSITTVEDTRAAVTGALIEWRDWLEVLESIFRQYDLGQQPLDKSRWASLISELITKTMEITGASDAWYAHAEQVLEWALQASGVSEEDSVEIVKSSLDGKWESWSDVSDEQIANTSNSIAGNMMNRKPE